MSSKDRRDFAGKTVLLTGGASGIGRACALELGRRGARLALVDIAGERLAETVREVQEAGGFARGYVVDVASAAAITDLVQRATAEVGPVDVLVNNAGVAVVAPLVKMEQADWEWIAGVNLWGPIRLTEAVLPFMLERRSGHVAFVASLAGLVGAPGMTAYSTTKFGVVGFAEALRLEVEDRGVAVTVVCPGFVRTNFAKASRYKNRGFARFLSEPPGWYGVAPERAATLIVDGIARREPLVAFGLEKLGWWLKRVSPRASHAVTGWLARRVGVLGRER